MDNFGFVENWKCWICLRTCGICVFICLEIFGNFKHFRKLRMFLTLMKQIEKYCWGNFGNLGNVCIFVCVFDMLLDMLEMLYFL